MRCSFVAWVLVVWVVVLGGLCWCYWFRLGFGVLVDLLCDLWFGFGSCLPARLVVWALVAWVFLVGCLLLLLRLLVGSVCLYVGEFCAAADFLFDFGYVYFRFGWV